ncbi:lycopene cyclase domain-containing protein [bacterium]|nr:lycopene cyclase domain-containing protein [bacterium]
MKYEYLLFNIIVIAGPVVFSFDRRVYYVSRWSMALLASVIVMIPYIIWDTMVTDSHWWFNEKYTLDFRLAGLPIGEWLFFITIPFACLFIWEIIVSYLKYRVIAKFKFFRILLLFDFPIGILIYITGKEYTALVLIFLGLSAFVDLFLKTDMLLQPRTYLYLAIITFLMMIFNGYLTFRPVILYGSSYQLGFRLGTIPLEDFGYGYTLILLCTMLFEKLKGGIRG